MVVVSERSERGIGNAIESFVAVEVECAIL